MNPHLPSYLPQVAVIALSFAFILRAAGTFGEIFGRMMRRKHPRPKSVRTWAVVLVVDKSGIRPGSIRGPPDRNPIVSADMSGHDPR